jgi:hypothetical protein
MGKYGTNREGFGAFEGGVNADKGAPLVSTSSDGETALLFGPAALREIQTGVANGDFAIPPDAAGDTITEENPLPYWTFTDVNSAGAITCAVVADAFSGSGNTLRFSITAGTPNSRSVTLRRFIPVASTRNQAFAYAPEVNTFGATNTAISTIRMQSQFYQADQTTTTGAVNDSGVVTFATLGTGSNWLTGTVSTANAAPADAAFCLITITVATAAAGTVVTSTVDIPEVRLIRGDQTNLFAEYRTPGTYAPTGMRQQNGQLEINPNGGTGNTQLGGSLTVVGGTIATAGDMTVASGNGDLIIKDTSAGGAPRLQFMTSDGTYRGGIRLGSTQNFAFVTGNTTDDYGFVLAERFYPMNGTAGSRYIFDNGIRTEFSGGIEVNASSNFTQGVFSSSVSATSLVASNTTTALNASGGGDVALTGADTSVPITGNGEVTAIPNTTTATTNSARWVLISGSTYGLRRDSSTRRVKTNIVQADEGVLAAAKRLRAVHFEPLEKDEDGNLRGTGQLTLGLIAEEIEEAGLGCAVTYDAEGLPDGYDERVLLAAMIHHISDLEARLAALEGA